MVLRWIRAGAPERELYEGEGWKLDFGMARRMEREPAVALAANVLRAIDCRSFETDEDVRAAACNALARAGHTALAIRVRELQHQAYCCSAVLES